MSNFIVIFWISVFATSNFSKECCAGQQSPQQATPSAPQASAQDTLLNLTKITSKSIGTFVIAYMLAPIAKKYIKKAITQAGFDKVKAAFNSITQAVAEHSKSNSNSTSPLSATSESPETLVSNQDLENAWGESKQTGGSSHSSETVSQVSNKELEKAWGESKQTGDSHGKSISPERIFDVGGTHDTSSHVPDATFEQVWDKGAPDIEALQDPSKKLESSTHEKNEKKLSTPPSESSPHTSESIHGSSHASAHNPPPTTGRTPTTLPLTTLGQTRRAQSLLLTSSDQKQVETWVTDFTQTTANQNNEQSPKSKDLQTTPTEKNLQESSKTQKVNLQGQETFQKLQKAWQESKSSKLPSSSTLVTPHQKSEINSKSSNSSTPSNDQFKQWVKEYKEKKAQLDMTKKAKERAQRLTHQPNTSSAESQQWPKEFSSKEGDADRLNRLEGNHSADGKNKLNRGESSPALGRTKTEFRAKL
jgi:hypothetical protein